MDDAPLLKAKRAGLLWLVGFRQACCLHRVVRFCGSSQKLLIRTGQCFLLNGLIFLGSLLFLYKVVIPTLSWILPDQCKEQVFQDLCISGAVTGFYSSLRSSLINLFYVFWFYPLYVFSFILSSLWISSPFLPEVVKKSSAHDRYNDIAKMAFERSGLPLEESTNKNEVPNPQNVVHVDKPAGIEGVIIGIGEQVYSALLLTIFYIEVVATGYIPFIGKAMNFLLLSWIYAYYCFEYKWNLSDLSLAKRLDFFESNWAFFAGFGLEYVTEQTCNGSMLIGSPCVLAIFFFSPLISYGVMAILFPLFVLTAIGTNEGQVISSQRRSWRGEGPRKLPIFYAANILSMKVLQLFPDVDNKVQ